MIRGFCIGLLVVLTSATAWAQGIDPHDGAALCAAAKSGLYAGPATGVSGVVSKGSRAAVSHASPAFDATYYHLMLDLDRARDPIVRGTVRVSGRVSQSLDVLDLDLSNNMTPISVLDGDGQTLNFDHASNTLSMTLARPAVSGADVTVSITYEGNPTGADFGTFQDGTVSGNPFIWTLSEPYGAREWWPNVDHPNDKADSVRVSIKVPWPMRAGSNGVLESETVLGDGTATYEWVHRYPISSYLVSVAAGVYDVYEQTYERPAILSSGFGALSLPVLHYAFEGTTAFEGNNAQNGWNKVVDILPVFEDWFGPYPFPEEKYGHAHTTFGGGMEHQTMSSMGGNGWGLVAHELTHMWYGDMITNRSWRDLWLHEGFATLGELLFWESGEGQPASHDLVFNLYYDRARNAQGTLVLEDTTSVSSMFAHARIYSKGGMVLHMLRRMMGDQAFRQLLRTWSADESVRYSTAESADFEHVAEDVTGLDLSTFFEQWVTEGTGYPTYEAAWAPTVTEKGPAVTIELRQTQTVVQSNRSVFEMPVDVVVHTATGKRTFTVDNNQRVQQFQFDLDAEATAVEIDPDRSILRSPDPVVTRLPGPSEFEWSIYPNPARDVVRLRLELPEAERIRTTLYDTLGRRITSVDLGEFEPGVYIRTVTLPRGTVGGQYVIELELDHDRVARPFTVIR